MNTERLPGARIDPIDATGAGALLAALAGPATVGGGDWADGSLLLATGDAGVTWGRWSADGGWTLASAIDPDLSPPVAEHSLHELRVFDGLSETLVWRAADGGMAGRRLSDGSDPQSAGLWSGNGTPDLWIDRSWVLAADHCYTQPRDGFTLVGQTAGTRALVPLEVLELSKTCLRIDARIYLAVDEVTGAARACATRLRGLRQAPRQEEAER